MKNMTRQEAIVEFEEFSKGGFNTFKFYAEGSIYRFPPSRSALFFLNGFYLISSAIIFWLLFNLNPKTLFKLNALDGLRGNYKLL